MKISFLDPNPNLDYAIGTPYQKCLPSSQTSLCYLCEAFAKQGQDILLFNGTSQPKVDRGVMCLPLQGASPELLSSMDVVVVLDSVEKGTELARNLDIFTPLILWIDGSFDGSFQKMCQKPGNLESFHAICFQSEWQQKWFQQNYPESQLISYTIGCGFPGILENEGNMKFRIPILSQKDSIESLTCLCTSDRDIDKALDIFRKVRDQFPEATMNVFVQQQTNTSGENSTTSPCKDNQSIERVKIIDLDSLSASEFLQNLRSTTIFLHFGTAIENSDVRVLEAMASACYVIGGSYGEETTKETSWNFSYRIPITDSWENTRSQFIDTIVLLLETCHNNPNRAEEILKNQQEAINGESNTWQSIAKEWISYIEQILQLEGISQHAYRYFVKENYEQAIQEYERAISGKPEILDNYGYYGLCLLLQGEEAEAQAAWFSPVLELDSLTVERYTERLVALLNENAEKFESLEEDTIAWTIRQHIREIAPAYYENSISLIRLSLRLRLLGDYEFLLQDLAYIIEEGIVVEFQFEEVIQLFFDILSIYPNEEWVNPLLESYFTYCQKSDAFKNSFIAKSTKFLNDDNTPNFAIIKVSQLRLRFQPEDFVVLGNLVGACCKETRYEEGIDAAEKMLEVSQDLPEELTSYHQLLRALIWSGIHYNRTKKVMICFLELLEKFIEEHDQTDIKTAETVLKHFQLITGTGNLPYLQDTPKYMHNWRGKAGQLWHDKWQIYLNYHRNSSEQNTESNFEKQYTEKQKSLAEKKLKVGYISSCFRQHSVGHLSRWLLQHHNRDQFEVYSYSLRNRNDSIGLFIQKHTCFRDLTGAELPEILKNIQEDGVDILIDLDGFTNKEVARTMLMKPASVQATWLGFDASGIPEIDYFIADPYVLPPSAQEYYNETIWRLPQTYIAVEGFNIGIPSIRREDLEIPEDAVVYFSSQTAAKRNPANIRLQMQIVREVPNSYFVTKTVGANEKAIQNFLIEIAAEEGVDKERLRFLPVTQLSETHRANIGIADVVLDTYPYNGATTTMETLWMEVPMVTRVGEQFAARNSYAMMVNAGIEEGIAWTDEEYVEWGIRLGKEPQLRQEVSWKLKQSKKSAPLWNAKQFTRDMEAAFQQMWQKYIEESSQ